MVEFIVLIRAYRLDKGVNIYKDIRYTFVVVLEVLQRQRKFLTSGGTQLRIARKLKNLEHRVS